jgi:tetratricopeptide (TPR) repeat protein
MISRTHCLEMFGQIEKALCTYRELLVARPTVVNLQYRYVECLLRLGKLDEADIASGRAINFSSSAPLLLQAARIAIKRNDIGKARAAINHAIPSLTTLSDLNRMFFVVPAAFEGWERTALWIELERKVRSLAAEMKLPSSAERVLTLRIKLALRDYEGFLFHFGHAEPLGDNLLKRQLYYIADALTAKCFPDFTAAKVFGIGLSKTGTTSLARALELLGLYTAHYCNNVTREILSVDDAVFFDALLDTPICASFEMLYFMFPNSKFVYTIRDLDSWVISLTNHYQRKHKSNWFDHIKDLMVTRGASTFGSRRAQVNAALFHHHEDARAAYLAFDNRVRQFFKTHDQTRILEMNICRGDGWDKLCEFLNREVPSVPFPRENIAPRGE